MVLLPCALCVDVMATLGFSVVVSDAVCTFGNGTDTGSLMTCFSMSAGVGLASGIAVYGE